MHAQFSYAHFVLLFIVHTHHCTVKSRNVWNQVQEKKVALFVMALQCMTLKYRHNNRVHTMERLVTRLNKSATFFQATCSTKLMLFWLWKSYNKLHGMTTQNLRKKITHVLHFKWTILIKYFSSYIKKCQTGTYFFWLSVYIQGGQKHRTANVDQFDQIYLYHEIQ